MQPRRFDFFNCPRFRSDKDGKKNTRQKRKNHQKKIGVGGGEKRKKSMRDYVAFLRAKKKVKKRQEKKRQSKRSAGYGNGAMSRGICAAIVLAKLLFLRLYGQRAEFVAFRI